MSDALFLEPIGGISGDLFLGALADLGLDLSRLSELLQGLGLDDFSLETERAEEHGIFGTRVTVRVTGQDLVAEPARPHDHDHRHDHDQGHGHDHDHGLGTHGHRPWAEIRQFLERLPEAVGPGALSIFEGLARAEAHIHGVSVDEVEFHEVGAVDSIVDIVGAAWGLAELGFPKVFTRPPPLGSGLVRSQHGIIPVPAPATVRLLAGLPTLLEGRGELTTPTGAAILSACASFELPAAFAARKTGYGVGHLRFEDRPNLLRVSLGEVPRGARAKPSVAREVETTQPSIYVLEAHLDDATPQVLAYLLERLLAHGALDAALSPLTMKKGRPGQRLTVVCHADERSALTDLVFRESTTIGVRAYPVEREELERRLVTVETPFGPVRVKLASLRGELVNVAPEYDDCVAAAHQAGAPLKEVMAAAVASAGRLSGE